MKVAILAGGHGTRLAEETEIKPKPMVNSVRATVLLQYRPLEVETLVSSVSPPVVSPRSVAMSRVPWLYV